ncbi:MAG: MlaD family protein [Terracidiphilus sp.]|jgi:phospholipid/cholesterol/gamma-HCH transport system substrate-binding protein
MKNRREEAAVGLFVLVAAALLIGTVLALAGTFSAGDIPHHTFFKSAGGLEPGAMVRYAGMNAGKVKTVRVDPQDSTRIEIDFTVRPDIPVKTDSIATIAVLGALSDNFLELGTGTKGAPPAASGSELKSAETVGLGDLGEIIGSLVPVADQTLVSLNQRLSELQVTIARVNDLLNDKNREDVSASLGNLNSMFEDSRPKVAASLTNVQTATAQLLPILDNLKTTTNEANDVLSHIDSVVVENHQDIRTIVTELRETLFTASSLMEQLKNTTVNNSDNLDQTILNMRATTENIKELTDSLKNNPSLLIRGNSVRDRKPGDPMK